MIQLCEKVLISPYIHIHIKSTKYFITFKWK